MPRESRPTADQHYGSDVAALRIDEGIAAEVLSGHIPNPFGRDDVLYFREEHVHPNYEKTQTMVMKAGTTTFWVDKKKGDTPPNIKTARGVSPQPLKQGGISCSQESSLE